MCINFLQAMDRAHRIGQTKPVLVLRLCTSDSVEVKLLRRANSKLALERLVIRKGAFQGHDDSGAGGSTSLSAQDLLEVLRGDVRLEVCLSAVQALLYMSKLCHAVLLSWSGNGSVLWQNAPCVAFVSVQWDLR
jgi:hypothetical protein